MSSRHCVRILGTVLLFLTSCDHLKEKTKATSQREETARDAILKNLTAYLASSKEAPFGDPQLIKVSVQMEEAPESAKEVPFKCDIEIAPGTRQPNSAKRVPSGHWNVHLKALRNLKGVAHYDGSKLVRIVLDGENEHLNFVYELDVTRGSFKASYRAPQFLILVGH